MLKINQFYWRLYKESPEGKKAIEKFEKASKASYTIDESVSLFKECDPEWFLNSNENETKQYYFEECFDILKDWTFDTSKSARNNAEEMIKTCFGGDFGSAISYMAPLSFYLFKKNPLFFIPYMFLLRYNYIRQILEDYDLDIKEVPGKANFKERCFYYLDICDALTKFREFNELNGAELCAFLYDMERKQYDAAYSKKENPFPQVWLTGGQKDGKEVTAKTMFWHANAETKKGDILIFYETGKTAIKEHKSCITGIWTAQTDGISDPLFYYYGQVVIGNETKIKPIPFKVLISDPRTNKLPRIGAHFLGISGDAVSTEKYEGLLSLIEERDPSFDRNVLPQLHEPYSLKLTLSEARAKGMKPEEWVEECFIRVLVEEKMKLRYKVDYDRQVHLQLGRAKIEGEKTQDGKTDFSLFIFGRKLKCADVLIEAKGPGEMDGKDIETAFWQAESYASRQYASLIILADDKKILLYPRSKDGVFRFSNTPKSYTWKEVFANTKDCFLELRNTIMKYNIHGRK
jgi:hypothetical protein